MIEENPLLNMFDGACKTIVKENIDDRAFTLCVNIINMTLQYLKSKRIESNDL